MPTSRRRVVNQQKNNPPVAHWSRTVETSRRILQQLNRRFRDGRSSPSRPSRREALQAVQAAGLGDGVDLAAGVLAEGGEAIDGDTEIRGPCLVVHPAQRQQVPAAQ